MNPISSLSASAAAISTGSRRLDEDAQQISDPNSPDVTSALVDSTQSLQIAQAGADVISASNQMLGTLLDIFA
jgi:hypothetical protein